jgi:hypothetical protein
VGLYDAPSAARRRARDVSSRARLPWASTLSSAPSLSRDAAQQSVPQCRDALVRAILQTAAGGRAQKVFF